jgi:sec-independent protein translocase protein TatA
MIGNLGAGEIMVILFVIMLLFGAKRLPELARAVGKSISEFKHGINSATEDIRQELQKTSTLK